MLCNDCFSWWCTLCSVIQSSSMWRRSSECTPSTATSRANTSSTACSRCLAAIRALVNAVVAAAARIPLLWLHHCLGHQLTNQAVRPAPALALPRHWTCARQPLCSVSHRCPRQSTSERILVFGSLVTSNMSKQRFSIYPYMVTLLLLCTILSVTGCVCATARSCSVCCCSCYGTDQDKNKEEEICLAWFFAMGSHTLTQSLEAYLTSAVLRVWNFYNLTKNVCFELSSALGACCSSQLPLILSAGLTDLGIFVLKKTRTNWVHAEGPFTATIFSPNYADFSSAESRSLLCDVAVPSYFKANIMTQVSSQLLGARQVYKPL